MTENSRIEGPIENVTCKKTVTTTKAMNPENAAGPSEVCAQRISASGKMGISVMIELCQRVLNGKGILYKWQMSVFVLI